MAGIKELVLIIGTDETIQQKQQQLVERTGLQETENRKFYFFKVKNGNYFRTLIEVRNFLVTKGDCSCSNLYVVQDYNNGRELARHIKRNLNKRCPGLRKLLNETYAYLIDIKDNSMRELFPSNCNDRNTNKYYNQKIA